MIFAAGLGTRLKPLTDTMPKALVPVGGKPLLEIQIRKLVAAGFTDIVVNVHHFAEQIVRFVEERGGLGGTGVLQRRERRTARHWGRHQESRASLVRRRRGRLAVPGAQRGHTEQRGLGRILPERARRGGLFAGEQPADAALLAVRRRRPAGGVDQPQDRRSEVALPGARRGGLPQVCLCGHPYFLAPSVSLFWGVAGKVFRDRFLSFRVRQGAYLRLSQSGAEGARCGETGVLGAGGGFLARECCPSR